MNDQPTNPTNPPPTKESSSKFSKFSQTNSASAKTKTSSTPPPSSPPTLTQDDKPLTLASSPPPPPVRKSPFRFVSYLIILLILATIGYFSYQYFGRGLNLSQIFSQSTPTPTDTLTLEESAPSPTLNPTANWLTRALNDTYQINYPPNFTVSEEDGYVNLRLIGDSQRNDTEFYDGIVIQLSQGKLTGSQNLQDFVKDKEQEIGEISDISDGTSPISINNLYGYSFTSSGLGTFQYIYLPDPNNPDTYAEIILATPDPNNQGYQELADDIVSTIKFIEPNISSPLPTLSPDEYVCPDSDYLDCMPKIDIPQDPRCAQDYLDWASENCEGFTGAVY